MSEVESAHQRSAILEGHLRAVVGEQFSVDEARQALGCLVGLNSTPPTAHSILEGGGKVICGRILSVRDMIYRCEECAADPTCVMCVDCFGSSPCRLQNHRVVMRSSGGGMCDCGDPSAWKSESFCDRHRPRNTSSEYLEGIDSVHLQWMCLAVELSLHVIMQCLLTLRKYPAPQRVDDDANDDNNNNNIRQRGNRRPRRSTRRSREEDSDATVDGLIAILGESAEWISSVAEISDAGRRIVAQALMKGSRLPGSDSILSLIIALDGAPAAVGLRKGEAAWANVIRAVRLVISDPIIKPAFAILMARLRKLIVLQEALSSTSAQHWVSAHPIAMEAVQVHTVLDVAQQLILDGEANRIWSALLLSLSLQNETIFTQNPTTPVLVLEKLTTSVHMILSELKYILSTTTPTTAMTHFSSTAVLRSLCTVSQAAFMTKRIRRGPMPGDDVATGWELVFSLRPLMRVVSRVLAEAARGDAGPRDGDAQPQWPTPDDFFVPQCVASDKERQLLARTTLFARLVEKCTGVREVWIHASGVPSSLAFSVGMLRHVVEYLVESDGILRPHQETTYPPHIALLDGTSCVSMTLALHRLMGLVLRHIIDALPARAIGETTTAASSGIGVNSATDTSSILTDSLRNVIFQCHPQMTIPALMSIADDVIMAQVFLFQVQSGLWKNEEIQNQAKMYENFDVVHFRSFDFFVLQVLACTAGPFRMASRIVARFSSVENAKALTPCKVVSAAVVFLLQLVSTTIHTVGPTELKHTHHALREVLVHALAQGLQRHSQLSAVAQTLCADEDEAQQWEETMIHVVGSVADEVLTQDGKVFRLAAARDYGKPSHFLHPYGLLFSDESLRKAYGEVRRITGEAFPPPRLPGHTEIFRDGLARLMFAPATLHSLLFMLHHQANAVSESSREISPSAICVFIDAVHLLIDAASQLTAVQSDTGSLFWDAVQRLVIAHADPQGREEATTLVVFESEPSKGDIRFALCDATVTHLQCGEEVTKLGTPRPSRSAFHIIENWLSRRKDEDSIRRKPYLTKILATIGIGSAPTTNSPIADSSADDRRAAQDVMAKMMQKARNHPAALNPTPAPASVDDVGVGGVYRSIALEEEVQCTICRSVGEEPLCYFAYPTTSLAAHIAWCRNESEPPVAAVVLHCTHAVHVTCFSEHLDRRGVLSGQQLEDLLMQGTGYRGMFFLGGSEIVCPCCHKIASSVSYAPRLLTKDDKSHTMERWVSEASRATTVLEVFMNAAYEASVGFNRGEDVNPLITLKAVEDGTVNLASAMIIRVMVAVVIPTLKADVFVLSSTAWRPEDVIRLLRTLSSTMVMLLASIKRSQTSVQEIASTLSSGNVTSPLDDVDAAMCRVMLGAVDVLRASNPPEMVNERIGRVIAAEALAAMSSGLSKASVWMRLVAFVMLRLVLTGQTAETDDMNAVMDMLVKSREGQDENGVEIPADLSILMRALNANQSDPRQDVTMGIVPTVRTSPEAWNGIAVVDLCTSMASDILHLPSKYLDLTAMGQDVTPLNSEAAARLVCLRCGECMFLFDTPAQLNAHARDCWKGCAYFAFPSQSKILWLNPMAIRAAEFVAPYVDAYGEHDEGLRRGRALHLSPSLAERFVRMVVSGNLEHETKIKLVRIDIDRL